ncbi:putative transporter SVOPL isoform X2 [Neoarius graeffei]|uniref:putative transporter SVOPL isoform X2 n=1 Tax=Neoarius graeffei TaxID=443677 RepID=UPI00298D3DCE|nr:putative transporter SVOPL isoform X2 [Neoarius graeffei]
MNRRMSARGSASSMKTQLVSAIQLQEFEEAELEEAELETVAAAKPVEEMKDQKCYTVEEAVESIGFGRFHVLLFVIMGSANIVEAMEIMLLAVVSPEVRCEWHLEDWQVALVSTMVFLGFMLCGVLSGYVADKYGRWKVVFGGFMWAAYFSMLTSFAPSYGWFIFLRSMVGCGVAATSQGFILKTEFIPAKYRGPLLPLATIFWMLGSMFIIILGMTVVPTMGWRWMIRFSVIPSVLLIILFQFIPESVRFQVSAGNVEKAVTTLKWIAKMNGASLPEGELQEPIVTKRGNAAILVSQTYKRTSLLLWYSWFVASFSYYGSVLSSSELLEKNLLCVINADAEHNVKHNTHETLCYCIPFNMADYQTLLISCLGEVALIPVNIGLLHVVGRKSSMIILQIFSAIFFMLVYPTTVRSLGMGFCTSFSRIGGMVAPFIAQVLMSKSVLLAMSPFALACCLCAIAMVLLPIETRGRALLQNE